MELYVVHIHQIEDSYPFGVFDSFTLMRSKIWELVGKTKHKDNNNWNDVLNLKIGESLTLEFTTSDWGWNTYFVISKLLVNMTVNELPELSS